MTMPFALLQAGQDQTLLYILIAMTVLVTIVLGKRFFVNLFEVITAPTASVHHHGKNETFFFSFMIVFLGGLIGALVLTAMQPQVQSTFKAIAADTGKELAQGNGNPNYRPMATEWAASQIATNLDTYVQGNIVLLPGLALALWLVIGLIYWVTTKIFGSQVTVGHFLGALSYPFFFNAIGVGLALPFLVKFYTNLLFGLPMPTDVDGLAIGGFVLMFYAMILLVIATIHSAEVTGAQFIFCGILFLIVFGGGIAAGTVYGLMPTAAGFGSQVKSLDPSKPGFKMPGAGAGPSLPPPSAPSTPSTKKDSSSSGDGDEAKPDTGGPTSSGGFSPTS